MHTEGRVRKRWRSNSLPGTPGLHDARRVVTSSGHEYERDLLFLHALAAALYAIEAFLCYALSDTFGQNVMLVVSTVAAVDGRTVPDVKEILEISMLGLTLMYFCTATLHHILVVLPKISDAYMRMVNDSCNYFRAAEYCVSAGIMCIIVLVIVGERNISTLAMVLTLNIMCQVLGVVAEVHKSLAMHFLGWVPFVVIWSHIFFQLWIAYGLDTRSHVHTVPLVIFPLFLTFGVVSYLGVAGHVKNYVFVEFAFTVMSLLTKTMLAVMVIFVLSETTL